MTTRNKKYTYIIRTSNMADVMKNKKIPIKIVYKYPDNSEVKDEKLLEYVKSLKIAPGYPIAYISTNPDTKILAISLDLKGKKQYRYHSDWIEYRMKQKNCKLIGLTEKMPRLIQFIENTLEDTKKEDYESIQFQIALILKIMLECNFRIGNEIGEQVYDSYGLTTLKRRHIKIKDNKVKIHFRGKKGVENICELCNSPLQKILETYTQVMFKNNKTRRNEEIENNGKMVNDGPTFFKIKSTDFNEFLKKNFKCTSKDIRSWMANMLFLYFLSTNIKTVDKNQILPSLSNNYTNYVNSNNNSANSTRKREKKEKKQIKQKKDLAKLERKALRLRKQLIKNAIEKTAEKLHHTASICKKSYLFAPLLNSFIMDVEKEEMNKMDMANSHHNFDQLRKIHFDIKNKERRTTRTSRVLRNHGTKLVPNQPRATESELFSTSVVYQNKELSGLFTEILNIPCKRMERMKPLEEFNLPKDVFK